ncbi:type II secretion system protein [Desulfonatronum parangueonense]
MRKRKSESGFTLLEIALVILIAGLLIGAVLNSRGIQEAGSSLRLQKQIEELKVAVDLYRERMGVLPGSSIAPATAVWEDDLVKEQLVTSVNRANTHAFGNAVDFNINADEDNQPFVNPGNVTVFKYDNIPAKWARTLVESLDNDDPQTGNIRVTASAGGVGGTPLQAMTTAQLTTAIGNGDNVFVFVRYN